jgi:hypothetical protein
MAGEAIFEFDRTAWKYHPLSHFEKIRAMNGDMERIKAFHRELDEAYYRDLSTAIHSEGLGDPQRVIAWSERRARECEQTGHPMVTGRSLERVFILRLAKGMEEMPVA